jgi:hypothetical protein
MINEANRQTESMRDLIIRMFNRQAERNGLANGESLNPNEMIDIDPETREWAQAEIAEGGYYSVENTADRIFSFASAVAGNNPETLERMQAAVEEGFRQAEQMWGGSLPQISQDTMARVREMFTERFDQIRGTGTA